MENDLSPRTSDRVSGTLWGRATPVLLATLAATTVVPWLPSEILLNGDDALYGAIARRMVEEGSWLFPRWGSIPFMDKPPLLLWNVAAFFTLFGISDVTARLFPALCGAGVISVCYALARSLGLPFAIRLVTCLLVAGSVWHIHYSRRLLADMPMVLCLLGATFFQFRAWEGNRGWGLVGLCIGGAMMLKGLATAPFLLAVVLHVGLFSPRWTVALKRLMWVGGTAGAVILPWHAAAWTWERREFLDTYLGYQVLAKLSKNVDLAGRPAWFYFEEFWIADQAMALLCLAAFVLTLLDLGRPGTFGSGRPDPAGMARNRWFLVLWIGISWGLFSAAQVKHTTYVLPTLAPLVLLLGVLLFRAAARPVVVAGAVGLAGLLLVQNTLRVSVTSTYWEEGVAAMGLTVARSQDLRVLGTIADHLPGVSRIFAMDIYPTAPAFYSGLPTHWVMSDRRLFETLASNPVLGRSGVALYVPDPDLGAFLSRYPGDLILSANSRTGPWTEAAPILKGRTYSLWRIPEGG